MCPRGEVLPYSSTILRRVSVGFKLGTTLGEPNPVSADSEGVGSVGDDGSSPYVRGWSSSGFSGV